MAIEITCPTCGTRNQIAEVERGRDTVCTFCFAKLHVPGEDSFPEIPGYRLLGLLGSGSTGSVYQAVQLSMEREVALKVIPAANMKRPEDQKRFMNEVRLLARLDHRGVVSAYEAGQANDYYYLAMSLIAGESLDARLRRDGYVPEKEALGIVIQVARALAYAWEAHRVLHRDVKPSNIMLTPEGETKLMDLGISKVLGAGRHSSVTATGMVVGTPYYMSPEQAVSTQSMDCRSDIYSLGATLYEMVTGTKPFEGDNPLEVMGHHRFTPLDPPRRRSNRVSRHCEAVICRMMAKRMGDRYQTWETLLEDLQRVAADQPPRHAADGGAPEEDDNLLRAPTRKRLPALAAKPGGARLKHQPVPAIAHRRPAAERSSLPAVFGMTVLIVGLAVAGIWFGTHYQQPSAAKPARDNAPAPAPATPAPEAPSADTSPDPASPAEPAPLVRWLDDFAAVKADYAANPEATEEAIRRFSALAARAADGDQEAMAREQLRAIRHAANAAREQLLTELHAEADALRRAGQAEAAIRVWLEDRGPHAAATREQRRQAAAELLADLRRVRHDSLRVSESFVALVESTAGHLVAGRAAEALTAWQAANQEPALAASDEMRLLGRQLTYFASVSPRILEAFRADLGKEIAVSFRDGSTRTMLIDAIGEGKVEARVIVRQGETVIRTKQPFAVADLSPAERLARFGQPAEAEAALVRAVFMAEAGRPDLAQRELGQAESWLAVALAGYVYQSLKEPAEAPTQALGELLNSWQIPLSSPPWEQLALVWAVTPSAELRAATLPRLHRLRLLHGRQPAIGERRAVLEALYLRSAYEPAMHVLSDSRLAAELTLVELGRRNEMNALAGLDISAGGYRLDLPGNPGLRDLGPLIGMPLVALDVAKTGVTDLGPLRGLPLRQLDLADNRIASLAPLYGLPLERLNLAGVPLADLSPLRGLPLRHLDLSRTPVTDLAPLAGAPLIELDLRGCESLTDLSPLASCRQLETLLLPRLTELKGLEAVLALPSLRQVGVSRATLASPARLLGQEPPPEPGGEAFAKARLEAAVSAALAALRQANAAQRDWRPRVVIEADRLLLDFAGHEALVDLAPLADLPLTELILDGTRVTRFGPLRRMPLKRLSLRGVPIDDLEPLVGLPLDALDLSKTPLRTIAPLAELPLTELRLSGMTDLHKFDTLRRLPLKRLWLDGTTIRDLAPLEGLQLELLHLENTAVREFDLLAQLPLTELYLGDSRIDRLDLLKGKALTVLHLANTRVKDLEPLRGMPLVELTLHGCERVIDLGPLAGCPTLERLSIPRRLKELEPLRQLPALKFISTEETPGWTQSAEQFWLRR